MTRPNTPRWATPQLQCSGDRWQWRLQTVSIVERILIHSCRYLANWLLRRQCRGVNKLESQETNEMYLFVQRYWTLGTKILNSRTKILNSHPVFQAISKCLEILLPAAVYISQYWHRVCTIHIHKLCCSMNNGICKFWYPTLFPVHCGASMTELHGVPVPW